MLSAPWFSSSNEWRYGGHALRMRGASIAKQALVLGQHSEEAPVRQMQGGPWNTYLKWLLKTYRQLAAASDDAAAWKMSQTVPETGHAENHTAASWQHCIPSILTGWHILLSHVSVIACKQWYPGIILSSCMSSCTRLLRA